MATSLKAPATADIIARANALFDDLSFTTARAWKAAKPGRKVIGYMPIYVPRELIHAADMLPLGIVGGGDQLKIRAVERLYLDELMATHDAVAGLQAFIAKRSPQWQHR